MYKITDYFEILGIGMLDFSNKSTIVKRFFKSPEIQWRLDVWTQPVWHSFEMVATR